MLHLLRQIIPVLCCREGFPDLLASSSARLTDIVHLTPVSHLTPEPLPKSASTSAGSAAALAMTSGLSLTKVDLTIYHGGQHSLLVVGATPYIRANSTSGELVATVCPLSMSLSSSSESLSFVLGQIPGSSRDILE